MKAFLAIVVLVSLWVVISASAGPLGPRGKMSGADPVYGSTTGKCTAGVCELKKGANKAAGNKTCSAYARICRSNNSNSPACQTSFSNCMNTGTFVGPQGATFTGMIRK